MKFPRLVRSRGERGNNNMPKNARRVYRTGKRSAQEIARDREVRRKVMEEFPPLEAAPESHGLSGPLRESIAQCGKSAARLAKEAKVSEVVLRQFLDGERDLRLATAERLMGI